MTGVEGKLKTLTGMEGKSVYICRKRWDGKGDDYECMVIVWTVWTVCMEGKAGSGTANLTEEGMMR